MNNGRNGNPLKASSPSPPSALDTTLALVHVDDLDHCDVHRRSSRLLQIQTTGVGINPEAVTVHVRRQACETCGIQMISTSARSIRTHYRKHHPDWSINCPHCDKYFTDAVKYSRHSKEHKTERSPPRFKSKKNDNQQESNASVINPSHSRQVPGTDLVDVNIYECDDALMRMDKDDPELLGRRARASIPFQLRHRYCMTCQCKFNTGVALAQHIVTHEQFVCLICGKEMYSDGDFREHQTLHYTIDDQSMAMNNFNFTDTEDGDGDDDPILKVHVKIEPPD